MNRLSEDIAHPAKAGCEACTDSASLNFEFDYAFQPIVDVRSRSLYGHEALIRGPGGENADTVLSKVNPANLYRFDQACRVKAIKSASELGLEGCLSINFMPNAIAVPELCIRTTLAAAEKYGFPVDNIIFEMSELERITDTARLKRIITTYKNLGFKTALDDFGAGYAGLSLLAQFQPDIIKIDMALVHGVDRNSPSQAIIKALINMSRDLGVSLLAEGVETREERDFLADAGIDLMQGNYFCRPAFRAAGKIEDQAWR